MNIRPKWSLQSDVWGSWDGREAYPTPPLPAPKPLFPHAPTPTPPTPTPSFPPPKTPIPWLPPPHAPTPTPHPPKPPCPHSHPSKTPMPPLPPPKPTPRRKITPQNYRCLFQAYLQELSCGSCKLQLNNRCMTFCGNVRYNELLVITHFWHCLGDFTPKKLREKGEAENVLVWIALSFSWLASVHFYFMLCHSCRDPVTYCADSWFIISL